MKIKSAAIVLEFLGRLPSKTREALTDDQLDDHLWFEMLLDRIGDEGIPARPAECDQLDAFARQFPDHGRMLHAINYLRLPCPRPDYSDGQVMPFPPSRNSAGPPPRRDTHKLLAGLLYIGLSVLLLWIAWFFIELRSVLKTLSLPMLIIGWAVMRHRLSLCRRGSMRPPDTPCASWKARHLTWWTVRNAGGIAVIVAGGSLSGKALNPLSPGGVNHLHLSLACVFMAIGALLLFWEGPGIRAILRSSPSGIPLQQLRGWNWNGRGVALTVAGLVLTTITLHAYLVSIGPKSNAPGELQMVFLVPGLMCLIAGLHALLGWLRRVPPAEYRREPVEY